MLDRTEDIYDILKTLESTIDFYEYMPKDHDLRQLRRLRIVARLHKVQRMIQKLKQEIAEEKE